MPPLCQSKDYSCNVEEIKSKFGIPDLGIDFLHNRKFIFVNHTWNDWDKNDLLALHDSYEGVPFWNELHLFAQQAATSTNLQKVIDDTVANTIKRDPKNAAKYKSEGWQKELKDKLLEHAKYAQDALQQLKPSSCGSWYEYAQMIFDANKEIKDNPLKHQTAPAINESLNVSGMKHHAQLDHQEALRLLNERGVKMDVSHELKSPNPKAIALNVVENIKGTVRAA